MARAEITNTHRAIDQLKPAMTTAEPAVVDAKSHVQSAAQIGRKLIEQNLTR